MDPKRLLIFRTVAREGSISAAARELGWTQPAVSQHLRALERSAGCALLLRGAGGVELTEPGRVLLARADALAVQLHMAEEELADLTALRRGRVRLAAYPSAAATLPSILLIIRWCRGPGPGCIAGDTSRSTRASAPSAMAVARSPRSHGQTRIQCPGSEDRCTVTGPTAPSGKALRSRRTQMARLVIRAGCAERGTGAARRTSACASGSRLPYQLRRRPIATSSFIAGSSRYRLGPSSWRISIWRTVRRGYQRASRARP